MGPLEAISKMHKYYADRAEGRRKREREGLKDLLERAKEWERNASPEEKAAMGKAQRESWIRAFTTPCEHGILDFEQCAHCRPL